MSECLAGGVDAVRNVQEGYRIPFEAHEAVSGRSLLVGGATRLFAQTDSYNGSSLHAAPFSVGAGSGLRRVL